MMKAEWRGKADFAEVAEALGIATRRDGRRRMTTNVHERLGLHDSLTRGGALVEAARAAGKEEARQLLAEWFNLCDAIAPWRDELREQFVRVGYVSDTDERLTFPVTIYRAAWEDDDVANALSWTTDQAFAEKFARMLFGPRAMYLGLRREGVEAYVWCGQCWDALGYFTSRDESEVVPAFVDDIHIVGKVVSTPRPT